MAEQLARIARAWNRYSTSRARIQFAQSFRSGPQRFHDPAADIPRNPGGILALALRGRTPAEPRLE